MKVLGLICLLFAAAFAFPAANQRSQHQQQPGGGDPTDCLKECINGVEQYGQELSILKNSDFSNYFNKLDETCEVIHVAQQCVANCGVVSNPFAHESLNIVCQYDTMEKIGVIKQCLQYMDHSIHETCAKECHGAAIIDETTKANNPMVEKANTDCSTFKCMARCNVEVVSKECGKNLGGEFQGLLQRILDTQRKDLEKLNLVETMAKTTPPECSYLYDPTLLFGTKPEETEEHTDAAANPEDDAKSLYGQAQLQLLLKQIELTEKQDQLVDRENAKLDMEMSYIAHKAHQREARLHAQAGLPIYMPMEKVPMESSPPHDGPMESEQHPSMHEAPEQPGHSEEHQHDEPSHLEQQQMEQEHSMPEESMNHEPQHPEFMSQQQDQPMPKMPKDDSMTISIEPMPMPMEGGPIPIEAIPFEGISFGMPPPMPRFF